MGAGPWMVAKGPERSGRKRIVLAWIIWGILVMGFLLATVLSIYNAINLRMHPFEVTSFDTRQAVILPDVQVCLVQKDKELQQSRTVQSFPSELLNTTQSTSAPPYNITIVGLAAGTSSNGTDWLEECPPNAAGSLTASESNSSDTPWQSFRYTEKAQISSVEATNSDGSPYMYPDSENDFLDFRGFELSPDSSEELSPDSSEGQKHHDPVRVTDNRFVETLTPVLGLLTIDSDQVLSKVMVGADPRVACLTFYFSLCAPQKQKGISGASPAFGLFLKGTGPSFSHFLVSVGQAPLWDPLDEAATEVGLLGSSLPVPRNSSINVMYVQSMLQRLQSPLERSFWHKPSERASKDISYTLGATLPDSAPNSEGSPQNSDPNAVGNFTLQLFMLISPRGVVHHEQQDPLLSVVASIGGLLSIIPVLFGLIYVSTVKEAALHPEGPAIWVLRQATKVVPKRSSRRGKDSVELDSNGEPVGTSEGDAKIDMEGTGELGSATSSEGTNGRAGKY